MTTDTTSVDALRTRLARAFEVAALRDPSAELAAFEAAVRREATDAVAVDREALAAALYRLEWDADLYATPRGPHTEKYERRAGRLIASYILLDAAAVRHEHGERIAKELEAEGADAASVRLPLLRIDAATRIARDLSPPP